MDSIKSINIVLAGVLFLGTALISYMIWHVLRKRHTSTPAGKKEEAASETNKPSPGKWGVEKDAYCYPRINDVMGFEFVKVVKVPSELTGTGSDKEQGLPSWEKSQPINGFNTVSAKETRENQMEDEPYPEKENPMPGKTSQPEEETEQIDGDVTTIEGFDQNEKMIASNFGEWPHENIGIPDEDMNIILDNNADMIEPPPRDESEIQTAREIDQFKKAFQEAEVKDFTEQVGKLLAPETEDDYSDTDTVDFIEDENYEIEENDLPDI